MRTAVLERISELPAAEWNRAAGTGNPSLRHEFLAALERHDCVGETFGWLPRHLVAYDETGSPAGVVPLYLKDNSYGEFVFDWSWADAYQRAGMAYFPKLVAAVPYTPVTGPRLLVRPDADRPAVTRALVDRAQALTTQTGASSLHWLFTDRRDTDALLETGFMRRTGCHFHWHNAGYTCFNDFLGALSSRKRKKIRRERRYVREAGIRMEIVTGDDSTEAQWHAMYRFYRSTFDKKSGIPTLTQDFFLEISRTMGEQVLLVFAIYRGEPVAGAIMLRGDDALYGRHWGCSREFHSLHFETCYYQGIEYCIEHGLKLFEPGAQGEHKLSRGFLPTLTWSAHWILDARFSTAIGHFLAHEHDMVVGYYEDMHRNSPYRQDSRAGPAGKGNSP